jgi:hypothetical protein
MQIDFSHNINSNNISVAPSIINEIVKNELFHCKLQKMFYGVGLTKKVFLFQNKSIFILSVFLRTMPG